MTDADESYLINFPPEVRRAFVRGRPGSICALLAAVNGHAIAGTPSTVAGMVQDSANGLTDLGGRGVPVRRSIPAPDLP